MVQDELTVRRGTPSLVAPARETPRESKPLSDLDDQNCMRIYLVGIYAFRGNASKQGVDPAAVVRGALAEALVHYYPLAGRLREEAGRKLVVDCAGQGVAFVEADANIALDDLGDVRYPPFPRSEEFVYDDHVYMANLPPDLLLPEIIGQPLLYVQFLKAVGELARGADSPSVPPVWSRDIFNARQPPCPSFPHPEFQDPAGGHDRLMSTPPHELERVEFSFGPEAIAALHSRAAPGKKVSRFDLVVACLWRSRTAALGYAPGDEVRCGMPVDARGKRPAAFGREIPKGFYGNAIACTVACCTAEELCGRDLGYAVGLIRDAKALVTYEYMQSLADRMVLEGRPVPEAKRTFTVSDLSNVGLEDVDFGWGKAVYGGPPMNALYQLPGGATFFRRRKNDRGEEETYGAIYIPGDCTERYMKEVEALTTITKLPTESAPAATLRARY
ncbi:hypothetical protein ACQ4PT_072347 [Festuca glaucescens]